MREIIIIVTSLFCISLVFAFTKYTTFDAVSTAAPTSTQVQAVVAPVDKTTSTTTTTTTKTTTKAPTTTKVTTNQTTQKVNTSTTKTNSKYFAVDRLLTYSQMTTLWSNLDAQYDKISIKTLGKSVDGRPIIEVTVGTGKNLVLFSAGIHARETFSTHAMLEFVNDFMNKAKQGSAVENKILNDCTIKIMPVVNPDGLDYCIQGPSAIKNKNTWLAKQTNRNVKTNVNGVNINRNLGNYTKMYLTQENRYFESVSSSPDRNNYPGPYSGSEPETVVIEKWFVDNVPTARTYADVHSKGHIVYSSCSYLPLDWYNQMRNFASGIASKLNFSMVPASQGYDNVASGNTTFYADDIAYGLKADSKYNIKPFDGETKYRHIERFTGQPKNRTFVELTIETLSNETDLPATAAQHLTEWKNRDLYGAFIKVCQR